MLIDDADEDYDDEYRIMKIKTIKMKFIITLMVMLFNVYTIHASIIRPITCGFIKENQFVSLNTLSDLQLTLRIVDYIDTNCKMKYTCNIKLTDLGHFTEEELTSLKEYNSWGCSYRCIPDHNIINAQEARQYKLLETLDGSFNKPLKFNCPEKNCTIC